MQPDTMEADNIPNCPLNTTECILEVVLKILREIQTDNSSFNWDPLSFIVTLAIGFVAVFFAALTIIQGLFSAGPGRFKCSRYAIGPWAKLTRREFDWQELRFRSIAETPLIVFPDMEDEVSADFKAWEKTLLQPKPSNAWKLWPLKHNTDRTYYPASWMALLTLLKMDHPDLWSTHLTGADHLPQELSAAPAFGTVSMIATLAVILSKGNCDIVSDPESSYPMVQGVAFQLRIRTHPVLRAVAVFEIPHFNSLNKLQPSRNPLELRQIFKNAQGFIEFQPPSGIGTPWLALMPASRIIMTNDKSTFAHYHYANDHQTREIISRLKQEWKVHETNSSHNKTSVLCCNGNAAWPDHCTEILSVHKDMLFMVPRLNYTTTGPLGLLVAQIPTIDPIIYPTAHARLLQKIEALVMQSRFWSMKHAKAKDVDILHYCKDHLGVDVILVQGYPLPIQSDECGKLEVSEHAFRHCIQFVARDIREELSYRAKKKLQRQLVWQIKSLDRWLRNKVGNAGFCRILSLGITATAVQTLLDSIEDNPQLYPAADTNYPKTFAFASPALARKLQTFKKIFNHFTSRTGFRYENGDVTLDKPETIDEHQDFFVEAINISKETDYVDGKNVLASLFKVARLWDIHPTAEGSTDFKFVQPDSVQYLFDNFFIYRAILIAALFSLAVDNSQFIQNNAFRQLVPFL